MCSCVCSPPQPVAAVQAKAEKPAPQAVKEDVPAPKRTRKAIADVEIDAETLMKAGKRAPVVVKKEADHSHVSRGGGMDFSEVRDYDSVQCV